MQDQLRDALTLAHNDHHQLEGQHRELQGRLERVVATLKGYIVSAPADKNHYTRQGVMQWLESCLDTRLVGPSPTGTGSQVDSGGLTLYCVGQKHGGALTGGGGVRGLLAAAGECLRTQESVEFTTSISPAVLFGGHEDQSARRAAATKGGRWRAADAQSVHQSSSRALFGGILLLSPHELRGGGSCLLNHHRHHRQSWGHSLRCRRRSVLPAGAGVPRIITDLAAYTMESAQSGPDSEAVAAMSQRDASLRGSVRMYQTLVKAYANESSIVVPPVLAGRGDSSGQEGSEASVSVSQYRSMLAYSLEKALAATLQPEGTTSQEISVGASVYFLPWDRQDVASAMSAGDFSALYDVVQRVSGGGGGARGHSDSLGASSRALLDGELGLVQQCVKDGRPECSAE